MKRNVDNSAIEIMQDFLQDFDAGVFTFPMIYPKTEYVLVVKTHKEEIFTAYSNGFFDVYLIKKATKHLGIITAFFDDFDEPRAMSAVLFENDPATAEKTALFSQESYSVYFFNEYNKIMLVAEVQNTDNVRFAREISRATFLNEAEFTLGVFSDMIDIFGQRTAKDDNNSYKMNLNKIFWKSKYLERRQNVGVIQEQEIAILLHRIFSDHKIYLRPVNAENKKHEFSDVLVLTNDTVIFVQAKDSPVEENVIKRSMQRRRSTIIKHIKESSNQMRRTLKYIRGKDSVSFLNNGDAVTLSLKNRRILGLIVVKELLDDDYIECGKPVLDLMVQLKKSICLLDYSQLHILTNNLGTPEAFFQSIIDAVNVALQHSQFPKSIHSGKMFNTR